MSGRGTVTVGGVERSTIMVFPHASLRAGLSSPQAQRAALHMSLAAGDVAGLVALCRRGDLSAEVDAILRAERNTAVRAAWIERPGRTELAIRSALRGERRVTVLAAAARCRNLSAATYEQIAAARSPIARGGRPGAAGQPERAPAAARAGARGPAATGVLDRARRACPAPPGVLLGPRARDRARTRTGAPGERPDPVPHGGPRALADVGRGTGRGDRPARRPAQSGPATGRGPGPSSGS